MYFHDAIDKTGKYLYSATVIPNRGAWLEYETDSNDVMWVRIDRTRKLPLTVLLRAIGYGTDAQIVELLGEDERLSATIERDSAKSREEGLLEIYRRLRPGEPPTVESATSLLRALFFDPKRYDLARVGRYKFNKKLAISRRISGQIAGADVIHPATGEVLVAAGETISREKALEIEKAPVNEVTLSVQGKALKVISNNFVDASGFLPFDPLEANLKEKVHYPTPVSYTHLMRIVESPGLAWDMAAICGGYGGANL